MWPLQFPWLSPALSLFVVLVLAQIVGLCLGLVIRHSVAGAETTVQRPAQTPGMLRGPAGLAAGQCDLAGSVSAFPFGQEHSYPEAGARAKFGRQHLGSPPGSAG